MYFPYQNVVMAGVTLGIGLALADRMIENGVFLIGADRRQERLDESTAKHGTKAAVSLIDITNLGGTHLDIGAVIRNSGIQCTLDFTDPEGINLDLVNQEITTNYTSYISLMKHLLPHLRTKAPQPTALMAVSLGLALSLRAQLGADEASRHIKVAEILPPAVQTELRSQQADLVERGWADIGISLQQFTDKAWAGLAEGKKEIPVGPTKERWGMEGGRKQAFEGIVKALGTK